MTTASTPNTVAVVGCTHAGTFATQSNLTAHPDWTVHVFERNDTLSFLSCGIALWVGGHVSDPNRMFYSSPAALADARRADAHAARRAFRRCRRQVSRGARPHQRRGVDLRF